AAKVPLAGAKVVAALDVGWVGAVSDFTLLDLAGVTDEAVAMLPGGHTSKRVDDALLRHRDVDALVLLTYPPSDQPAREAERRVGVGEARFGPFHARHAEVEQLQVVLRGASLALELFEEDVARLQIAVNDAGGVNGAQGVTHLQGERQ